jgi:hypothetical protein
MTTDIVRFKDFTPNADDPPTFRVYGNTYVCLPDIPLDSMADMSDLNAEDLSSKEKLTKTIDFLAGCLTVESGALFRESTRRGATDPVGVSTLQALVPWLMEQYGLRPTQESSESSDGSTDDDGNLTDGV